MELFDHIGEFFDSYGMFIQDPPVRCDRRVRYRNPQRLSSIASDSCLWTSHFDEHVKLAEMKLIAPSPELLDLFDLQSDLAETAQPSAVTTTLQRYNSRKVLFDSIQANKPSFRHQKQALTFMLERERGWRFDASNADLWDVVEVGFRRL